MLSLRGRGDYSLPASVVWLEYLTEHLIYLPEHTVPTMWREPSRTRPICQSLPNVGNDTLKRFGFAPTSAEGTPQCGVFSGKVQ
jgi:hypothetical protein